MNKVLVIGCAGSGKSTFSRHLAAATGLPLIHLDQHYWLPGWIAEERSTWLARLDSLLAEPHWIMDGSFPSTLAQRLLFADTVIVLEAPRWLCLWRVFWRTLKNLGRTRTDMTAGCPERFDWEFNKYIWTYDKRARPGILQDLQNLSGRIIQLGSTHEVTRFLKML